MDDVMQYVLPVIEKLNELTGSALVKKLVETVGPLVLQGHLQARIQKSDLL
ncbi:hypothetical protein D3C81_1357530 [compost metagenome]